MMATMTTMNLIASSLPPMHSVGIGNLVTVASIDRYVTRQDITTSTKLSIDDLAAAFPF